MIRLARTAVKSADETPALNFADRVGSWKKTLNSEKWWNPCVRQTKSQFSDKKIKFQKKMVCDFFKPFSLLSIIMQMREREKEASKAGFTDKATRTALTNRM